MTTYSMNMTAQPVRRIAIFYDGLFFQKFNSWCKNEFGGYVNFQAFHDYLTYWVSKEVEGHKVPQLFRVVEAHYFQGRFLLEDAIEHGRKKGIPFRWKKDSSPALLPPEAYYITKDRQIDEVLMYANITTHYYPVRHDPNQGQTEEKGIDVWLSLEAYDLAVHKRFDYFLLFSGDEDFVPLVRKINSLGITTIIISVDVDHPEVVKTSYKLIQEASYHLCISEKMKSTKALGKDEQEMLEKIPYRSAKS